MKPILVAVLSAGLLVGGCHKRSEESAPEPDLSANATETEALNTAEAPNSENLTEANASIVELPRPPKAKAWPAPVIPPDQQTQDDADATGMTAHVSPDGDAGGGNSQ